MSETTGPSSGLELPSHRIKLDGKNIDPELLDSIRFTISNLDSKSDLYIEF